MTKIMEYCGLFLWIIYLYLFFNREIARKNKYVKEYNKELINEHTENAISYKHVRYRRK